MKTKITKMETRAQSFCRSAVENGFATVNVEWRKSRDYGYCPAVTDWQGEKMAYASGCGYDKLSAVLVDLLQFLSPDVCESLAGCSGAGLSSVQRKLKEHGWTLEQTANGNTFAAFKLTRDEVPACQECNGAGFITDPRSGGGKVYLPHPCHVCNAR